MGMLDKSVDPCTDFYAYACSKWEQQNPIPADRPGWGRFNELQERGEYIVRDILEKSGPGKAGRSPVEQKIGDYYASCMQMHRAGYTPSTFRQAAAEVPVIELGVDFSMQDAGEAATKLLERVRSAHQPEV